MHPKAGPQYGDQVDYVFDRLDLTDDSKAGRARRTGYLEAVQRGFHATRVEQELEKHWLAHIQSDEAVCAGAWLPETEFGAGPVPVATCAWFDKDINAGHDHLPLRMITDVTSSPAHRRRGLVRRLMEDCLADAARLGLPVAALTASEATIYGRWGFGVATFAHTFEVDTGPRFRLRGFRDPGRMELIDPPEAWPVVREVFEQFHARTRGSVAWPHFYQTIHTGAYDFDEGGPDKKLRGAVHLNSGGDVDGVVLYRYDGRDGDKRKIAVTEMFAVAPTAGLALWQFLGDLDLVNQVTHRLAVADDPLLWALEDINAVKHTARHEFLWLRVLDVPRTLMARPWATDGEIVLQVEDAQRYAAGRYRVSVHAGMAEVAPTDAAAQVTMDAETLGSLSLGGVGVTTLYRAGRLGGDEHDVTAFAAMADLAEPPYCLTGF